MASILRETAIISPCRSHRRSGRITLMITAVLSVGAAVLPLGAIALAQSDSTLRALSIPSAATLRCHSAMASAAEAGMGAHTHLHFELVRRLGSGAREDDVWFDSTGKALSLTEALTTVNSDGSANVDGVTIVFAPTGQVLGTHSRYDGASPEAKNPVRTQATTPLTQQQSVDARTLAEWLWKHRCSGKSAAPNRRTRTTT